MGQDEELGQNAARSEKAGTWAKGKCDWAVVRKRTDVCTCEHLWGQLG